MTESQLSSIGKTKQLIEVDGIAQVQGTVARGEASLLNSGVKSADTLIKNGAGGVYWLTVSDTAALALELNDSLDNSGADKWALVIPADGYGHFIFDPPIEFATGIYLDVSTVTCKIIVGYI